MSYRNVHFVSAAVALGLVVLASLSVSAGTQAGALIRLQATTPGAIQTGHLNISGTARAGQFVGGGAGLTGLNASNISSGILDATSLPLPMTLSGSAASEGVIAAINSSSSGIGLQGSATSATGTSIGVLGLSNSSSGLGVYGAANGATGITFGVKGAASSTTGRGVYGLATAATGATYGGYFQVSSSSGTAVLGTATASGGATYGGYFESNTGTGVFASGGFRGVSALAESHTGGAAVFGHNVDTNPGTSYGMYSQADGSQATAIMGISTATSGNPEGIYGKVASTGGRAVVGEASALTGSTVGVYGASSSSTGAGVVGIATNPTVASAVYGVRGEAPVAGPGQALFALGDFAASGVKSFRIDHPTDPANKYLFHYCSESPFPQNFYNGNVRTDEKGYAWVELPDYFEEINANIKYQLTVISEDFAQAIVSRKARGNRFQIRTNQPNIEVSWRVEADRNDERVRYNRPVDVREKISPEQGKYQHPEFYGLPESMGIGYRPR